MKNCNKKSREEKKKGKKVILNCCHMTITVKLFIWLSHGRSCMPRTILGHLYGHSSYNGLALKIILLTFYRIFKSLYSTIINMKYLQKMFN